MLLLACRDPSRLVRYDLMASLVVAERTVLHTEVRPGLPRFRADLGAGWSWAERSDRDEPFAWSHGAESTLRVAALAPGPHRLVLRGFPFQPPGSSARQSVEVSIGAASMGKVELGPDAADYSLPVPAEALELGWNRVRLVYGYTASSLAGGRAVPARRDLGVGWIGIALVAAEDAPPSFSTDGTPAATTREGTDETRQSDDRLELHAGEAITWPLDLGPRSTLELADVRPTGAELAIWAAPADRGLQEIATVSAPGRHVAIDLPVDASAGRLATWRLVLVARPAPGEEAGAPPGVEIDAPLRIVETVGEER